MKKRWFDGSESYSLGEKVDFGEEESLG